MKPAARDSREERQQREEFDVDEIVDIDLPLWYLSLTRHVSGHWRREVAVVVAAFAIGAVSGAAVVLAS